MDRQCHDGSDLNTKPGTQWSEVECSTTRPSAPRLQTHQLFLKTKSLLCDTWQRFPIVNYFLETSPSSFTSAACRMHSGIIYQGLIDLHVTRLVKFGWNGPKSTAILFLYITRRKHILKSTYCSRFLEATS